MLYWLSVVMLLTIAAVATADDRWPSASGEDEYLLMFDQSLTTFTSGQCWNTGFNQAATVACTGEGTARVRTASATRITRWRVATTIAPDADTGCALTLLTDVGDVATTTKPAFGDDAEAGYTILSTTSPYMQTVPAQAAAITTAGGYFSVRFNDLAGASVGDDGTCAGAVAGGTIFVYGHAQ